MMGMRAIEVTLVDEDKGHRFGTWIDKLDEYSWLDNESTMGDIYRAYQREYGRCQSKVYVDQENGPPKAIGWYFVSRQQYEDTQEYYLRGAWVMVGEYVPGVPEHIVS